MKFIIVNFLISAWGKIDLLTAANNQVHANMTSEPHQLCPVCVTIMEPVDFDFGLHVQSSLEPHSLAAEQNCNQNALSRWQKNIAKKPTK